MGAILIIDDDETNNFYVRHILSKLGITENFYFAHNGKDALKILRDLSDYGVSTDHILLDINMPIMNGFEFLDEYDRLPNANRSKTTITMMSSSVNSTDMKKSKTYKSIDHRVEKPLTIEKLENILSNVMEGANQNKLETLKDKLNRIGNNDADFIQQLISIFTKNAKLSLDILNDTNTKNTTYKKQQTAHKLKSNFQLFEYPEAQELASRIEKAITTEEMLPYIKRLSIIIPAILEQLAAIEQD